MTIKLVRTDATEPCKILLPLGDHVIGRGNLLECDDKKISRQHGQLHVSDDSLSLKALHHNPCFYIKKGLENPEILKQNRTIALYNGDKFGLLPDAFWYEVLFCSSLETQKQDESEKNTDEYCVENNECNDSTIPDETRLDNQKKCNSNSDEGTQETERHSLSLIDIGNNVPTEVLEINAESTNSIHNILNKACVPTEIEPSEVDELNEPIVQNESNEPIVQNESNEPNLQNEPTSQNCQNVKNEPFLQNDPNEHNEEAMPSNSETNTTKRSHSPDNSDVKKIKTEPVEVKTENADDVKPGPSLAQGQGAQPTNDGGANGGSNNNPLRERCMYGANCYRKNPQHLAQFSHPRDVDWGPGERGVCPYGAACAKTDPRHWRDHEHPPGKLPPPRPGKKIKRQRRDSEDSLSQSVIVPGKRVRKTVQAPGHWSGDESDEPDPYATDESDEWQPGSAPSQDYSEDY